MRETQYVKKGHKLDSILTNSKVGVLKELSIEVVANGQ